MSGFSRNTTTLGSVEADVSLHVLDVSDSDALEALPARVLEVHRTVDVLVNNAGVTSIESFEEYG